MLGPADGMPRPCVVNLDTILTVPKARIQRFITELNSSKLRAVDDAIHYALDLSW